MATAQKSYKGELTNQRGDKITVSSPVVVFEQDGTKIIYSPTLELYGYGKNLKEARSSLNTSLEEFINYTLNKGTFAKELKRLGWHYKKRQHNYIVPSFSEMLRKNRELIKIIDNNAAEINQEKISLPAT